MNDRWAEFKGQISIISKFAGAMHDHGTCALAWPPYMFPCLLSLILSIASVDMSGQDFCYLE